MTIRHSRPLRLIALAASTGAILALAACSRSDADEDGRSTAKGALAPKGGGRGRPVIAPVAGGYRPGAAAAVGSVRGSVRLDGEPPPARVVPVTVDQGYCSSPVRDSAVRASDGGLADAIVWLADVRTGKRIPLARRFELANDDCRLEPRVQAVLAGGTLNVKSHDVVVHRIRFTRQGTGEVADVVTHNDHGQVVPSEKALAEPGLLEVRCDVHPWTHGWVAAFDHPYFDRTDARGAFALDSVPPGRYRLVAWHERFGSAEQSVTVEAGKDVDVALTFRGGSAAAAAQGP